MNLASEYKTEPTFAQLFKFFRIKSGFKTLSHFADTLAEQGFAYSDSLFSHWQRGSRIPTNRDLILAIIKIFIKTGSIKYESQANLFLNSAKKRNLKLLEKNKLTPIKGEVAPNSWKKELEKFILSNKTHNKFKSKETNGKVIRFNFILSANTYLYFEKASKTDHLSKADFLRKLIEEHRKSSFPS